MTIRVHVQGVALFAKDAIHDPDGEQNDQRIEQYSLPGILPLSEANAE